MQLNLQRTSLLFFVNPQKWECVSEACVMSAALRLEALRPSTLQVFATALYLCVYKTLLGMPMSDVSYGAACA